MSATLTFKRFGLFAFGLALLAPLPAVADDVEVDSAAFGFFSFIPAKPELTAPNLRLVMPWASDMTRAQAAYREGDYATARDYLGGAAEKGDLIANWYLGHMYRLGRGVNPDPVTAFHYYSIVVAAFDPQERDDRRLRVMVDSLVRVADMHRSGKGAARDPAEAYRMYNMAASFGHPAAHYALGVMCMQGTGVKRNPEMALKWLVLAARKRYAPAEAALGDLYFTGDILRRDRVRALTWYMLAVQNTPEGEYPEIFERFTSVQAEATDAELAAAEERARKWDNKYPARYRSANFQGE